MYKLVSQRGHESLRLMGVSPLQHPTAVYSTPSRGVRIFHPTQYNQARPPSWLPTKKISSLPSLRSESRVVQRCCHHAPTRKREISRGRRRRKGKGWVLVCVYMLGISILNSVRKQNGTHQAHSPLWFYTVYKSSQQ